MTNRSYQLYINGQWLDQASGGTQPVSNPATQEVLGQLPLVGPMELEQAAAASVQGFALWRSKSPFERQQILARAAQLMRDRCKDIATRITEEQGKPLSEAMREVSLSADILDFQAEEGKRLYGREVPPRVPGIYHHSVRREPIGPVLALTAWNFPVNLATRKLASALAAGCSVILKSAEETPGACIDLVRCFVDAGVPGATVQLVFGHPPEVSSVLIAHPAIRKISFTGSVRVGRILAQQCAAELKSFTPELGGHAAVVVAQDAHLPFVLKSSMAAKYRNAGQVCASPIHFLVHQSQYQAFCEGWREAANALTLGPGLDPKTQMGPLVAERRVAEMQQLVQDALDHGAQVLCGGKRRPGPGYFFEPTALVNASEACAVRQQEPFGPIAIITPFDTLEQAIEMANATPYGLAAYAFTRDLVALEQLSSGLHVGMVGINHFGVSQPELPFGGIKDSGWGQEMGAEGLLGYTEIKTVTVGQPY